MSEIRLRHTLRDRETNQLFDEFSRKISVDLRQLFGPRTHVEVAKTQTIEIFFINCRPLLAKLKDLVLPTLQFQEVFYLLPKIVVNMGAVPHVCNGADIMAPGIVEVSGGFKEKTLVVVLDERNRQPIAIAQSLCDSEEAKSIKKGKLFKNFHYVGDDIWKIAKERKS